MVWWAAVTQLFSLAAFSSPLVEKLSEKAVEAGLGGLQWAYSFLDALFSVEAELAQLRRTAKRIGAILKDAEETRFIEDEAVRGWLADLKDFAFDVEDLVDEFQTILDVSKLERTRISDGSRKRKRLWHALPSRLIWLQSWKISGKIKEIKERYREIKQSREDLQLREGESRRRQHDGTAGVPNQAGSLQGNSLVLGLEDEKDKILMLLKQGSGEHGAPDPSQREESSVPGSSRANGSGVSVVAIVGPGGIGKTTLARLVFDDEQVKSSSFLKIWVGVSLDFNMERITKEIIQAITKKSCDGLSLDLLQRRLQQLVLGRKFLLVLDGLWREDWFFWEGMLAPLMAGGEGSRILVTSRSKLVLTYMRPFYTKCLQGLGENDSWSLFCSYAFKQGARGQHHQLEQHIGREIVNRCQGSPLAIISIGGLLYYKETEAEWMSILSDIPDPQDDAYNILSTFKVSYDHLPLHLKQCFAFCSIFPNGYGFDKDELVKLWIAVGLVKRRVGRSLEYMGYKYFDCLLWRSFFQSCDGCHHQKQKYKMPGLIHELAQSVSAHECLRIESDAAPDESENARYALSCNFSMGFSIFQKIYQNKKLRAFILLSTNDTPTMQVPHDLYLNLRYLRVLDLRKNELTVLPDSIGNLIHLRYLNLYGTQIEGLPESLCSLYNLLVLELGDCNKLVELPKGMSYLINLQHLGLHLDWEIYRHNWSDLIAMPPGLGRLTSLRTLSRFSVSERGCRISELKGLELQGEICISKLENVVDIGDAQEANLSTKKYIDNMMLRWTDFTNPDSQNGVGEDVIEQLRPHGNLKHLWIENYKGAVFPSWLEDQSMNLETLRLYGCERCDRLPLVGRLQNLNCLYLEGLHAVTCMGSLSGNGNFVGFPSLKMITISKMNNLEKGFELVQGEMPCLGKLVVSECSNLLELPQLPNSLEDIEIRECPELSTLPMISSLQHLVLGGCRQKIIESIPKFTSLSSLTISKFPQLGYIPKEYLQYLRYLKKLKIEQCVNLISLASQDLVSLETLEISSCPEFSSFSDEKLPASLKDFQIRFCDKLTSLPRGLHLLPFLHYMEIQTVRGITSLPARGMPASLQYLTIGGCPTLEQRCQRGGDDWHKIENIPHIEIGENSTF